MNVLNYIKKDKKNNNYDAYVIFNFSNGYIHLYWTGPLTFDLNGKCMGKCSINSKNNGENIISSLHIVWIIFVSNLSMYCICNLYLQLVGAYIYKEMIDLHECISYSF